MPTKPFYKSTTIWSAALLFLIQQAQQHGVTLADLVAPLSLSVANIINALPPLMNGVASFAAVIGIIVGRFRAAQPLAVRPTPPSTPPANPTSAIRGLSILLVLGVAGSALTGCAGTLPSQFENFTPALTTTETKVVLGAAALDTPAALAGIESGSGALTSGAMALLIKQSSTMQTDGLLLYGCGQEMEALPSGSINAGAVDDIFSGAKANASTTASAATLAQLGTSLDGLIGAARTYVTSLATSSSNPSVTAYVATVFGDDVHAIGKGICDATAQYAPVTAQLRLRLNFLPPRQHLLCLDL
jgi:hypothetical protein